MVREVSSVSDSLDQWTICPGMNVIQRWVIAMLALPNDIQAEVSGDTEHPGLEFSAYLKTGAGSKNAQKGLLRHFSRRFHVFEVVETEAEDIILIAFHQHRQRQVLRLRRCRRPTANGARG